jgi:hypothetical protein
MKLAAQWEEIERGLAPDWQAVRLVVSTEQPDELPRASQVLAPLNAGRRGGTLAVDVRRAGGAQGPEAARRLFARLDTARIWCRLEQGDVTRGPHEPSSPVIEDEPVSHPTAVASWDAAMALLPDDWSDVLCELELFSSDHLPRAALLCAPLNPTRDLERVAFTFRCSGKAGYGASPGMSRRCLGRLDAEGITASVRVLRAVSDADNVSTQGTVWIVEGRAL